MMWTQARVGATLQSGGATQTELDGKRKQIKKKETQMWVRGDYGRSWGRMNMFKIHCNNHKIIGKKQIGFKNPSSIM